jgi:hypothetical protein
MLVQGQMTVPPSPVCAGTAVVFLAWVIGCRRRPSREEWGTSYRSRMAINASQGGEDRIDCPPFLRAAGARNCA